MNQRHKPITRRDFLRMIALGAGSAALYSCGVSPTSTQQQAGTTPGVSLPPVSNVKLLTGGWPTDIPFTNPTPGPQAGYNKAFQAWLDKNPGVKVERIEFNVWDAAGLRTGVAGGTAPFSYPIGVLGGWNVPGIQASNVEGLFADITQAFENNHVQDLLDPKVAASTSRWKTQDGRIFGIPYEVVSSEGFFFNRAHLAEIGMDSIPEKWSWTDMRDLALKLTTPTRKGLAMAAYALDWILPTSGIDFDGILSHYPIPGKGFNWRWDFTTYVDDMVEGVNLWRAMMFEDKSVFSDPNYWDFSAGGQLATAFSEGKASMTPGIHLFFQDLATKMNMNMQQADQFMGYVHQPYGSRGYTYQLPFADSAWGFNPDLNAEELDKAISLFAYLLLGDGFVTQAQEIYAVNKDASDVVRNIRWPFANKYSDTVPGVPGSLNDAIGRNFSTAINALFALPKPPEVGEYVPPEVNRGPGDTPWYDKLTRWGYSQDAFDVKTDAAALENILNQQAKTFPSSVDQNAFAAGINKYYADVTTYLQANAPTFYEERFKPFYDLRIAPEFG